MRLNWSLIILLVAAVLGSAYFVLDVGQYLHLDYLRASRTVWQAYRADHPVASMAAYFLAYVAVAALSLPGATVMTLAGGAIFGLVGGTLLVSFASSLGATLAFLASRHVLRDALQRRCGDRLAAINAGIARDGALYLFSLRLIPVVPFFLINVAAGVTPIRTRTFYWVSQAGMLAGTVVRVNAGVQLGSIEHLPDMLSPGLLGTFVLLGLLPLMVRKVVAAAGLRRVHARWPKPRRFDRNLVVIGAGAAGLVTAYLAAALKAKVTLVEGGKMGGDCLNSGCVPSKALLRSARFVKQAKHAAALGMASAEISFDFAEVMARVHRVIATVAPHDSAERYAKLGVEVIQGRATITSPWTVEVNGRTLATRAIVIAAGAEPLVPPIPGLEAAGYYTTETIWSLRALPRRLVVLGGGPVGCELAQAFARFGAEVTLVQRSPRLLVREDTEASALIAAALAADGVRILVSHRAVRCDQVGGLKQLIVSRGEQETGLEFDALLCAVGRRPRTAGYGLEALGIPLTPAHAIETNAYLQTLHPNIYACGDVAGPFQFTHAAAHQAWYATVNALFGGVKHFRADYTVMPWCTFTDPEVARVGRSERDCKEQGIPYEVTRYDLGELDRAITDECARGFVKVLTVAGRDRILGVTIVGDHAGDLLAEYVLAMKHGLGLNKILATVHTYPTLAEANKYAAGAWKQAHAPQQVLRWLARFHAWRRGGVAAMRGEPGK
ncbi:FAD-dependent oxidoreductase [Cupriavidus sp. TMH.W2]|uniref:FAD-dependent oxidoreductase n=1 Tax=Cupriavidus sp. TMH.W2 TaxID=3434465 RepID=UPI003D76F843